MDSTGRYEISVLLGLIVVLITGVFFSGLQARRERRDGVTRGNVLQAKRRVEDFYNKLKAYPSEIELEDGIKYVVSSKDNEGVVGWYVRGALENRHEPESGFNYEYNVFYRITEDGFYDICGGDDKCRRD